ncbi:MAG: 2Fe-2S iron-sulfur cluster-binding protein [Pseudomonadota bacterium]
MPRITFVQPDGTRITVDVAPGKSVMEGAREHGVPGILAECGGECSCSTCHCYVDDGWTDRLPPKDDAEAGLIDFAWEPRATSRLTCQLRVTAELDGLVLHVPAQQLS